MALITAVLAGVGDKTHLKAIHLLAGILDPARSGWNRHGDLYARPLAVFRLRHIDDVARGYAALEAIAEQLGVMPESRQVVAGHGAHLAAEGGCQQAGHVVVAAHILRIEND